MKESIELTRQKVGTSPSYGGSTTHATYDLIHKKNGFTNNYEILFEVRISYSELDTYLTPIEVISKDNNEETLTEGGVYNLLEI